MIGSAHGQDAWVIGLLGGQRGGYFLDSGAFDGVEGSNTVVLERGYGWSGLCVEPDDAAYESLARNRACAKAHCCLYTQDGEADFVEAGMLGGIVGDYHPDLLALARRVYSLPEHAPGQVATMTKPTRTARALLREAGAPSTIDYWSLDTEGSELAILQAFPFDEYVVRALTVEHNNFPVREDIHAFLTSHGFVRVGSLHIDDCYVRAEEAPASAWRSRVWGRG
jgi:hypothetical protein